MYYNRIRNIWVIDAFDIFLLSAFAGSILASRLKNYVSEKKAMERLKNSIIKKSKVISKSDKLISNAKDTRLKKIYKVALENRGGQFENAEPMMDAKDLALKIQRMVEKLAHFLKERELQGFARIFFKSGRLILELILYKCKIDLSYGIIAATEELSTQVIVITSVSAGAGGFVISWFSAGAILVAPPVLISILLIRSVTQQVINQREFSKFKKLVNEMLQDDKIKETVQAIFVDGEIPRTTPIKMKSFDSDKNSIPEFNFDSDQTFEEFTKARMQEELGLVENPTPEQIEKIIYRKRINKNRQGKVVYFKDFIEEIAESPDDIIDAEIIQESTIIKVKNE